MQIHDLDFLRSLFGKVREVHSVCRNFKDGRSKGLPTTSVNGYYAEIQHFISCLVKDEKPMLDPRESRETLKVTLAALESAESGKRVKVYAG